MADFLLGIDYGTGGAKACIIDTQGQVLGFAFKEYPFYHDKPGWSEHDPVLYWTIACEMIHDCIAQARIDPAEIRGVAVSSALPSLVMVDRHHNPIHRAYNLMDRRATAQVAWLKEHVGEARIQQLTGNRIEDHPTIVNLLWEKSNRADAYRTIWKALTIDGFITLRLTGQPVANYCAAPFYGVAYDLLGERFDEQFLAADRRRPSAAAAAGTLRGDHRCGDLRCRGSHRSGCWHPGSRGPGGFQRQLHRRRHHG